MSAEPESFLTRWSRRKRAAEREAERPAADTAAPQVPAAPAAKPAGEGVAANGLVSASASAREPAATTEVPLPPIESLDGLRSDYQAFFQQPVADELRHAALKKLFADPHFNKMDMLDVYVDDYTQFEPLPAAMRTASPECARFPVRFRTRCGGSGRSADRTLQEILRNTWSPQEPVECNDCER